MGYQSALSYSSKKILAVPGIKVCVVCPVYHPGLGGIGRQAVSLTEELHNRGLNLFVITRKLKSVPSYNVSDVRRIKIWAYRPSVYRIEKKTIPNLLTSVTFSINLLITLIRNRRDYDLVHFHGASIPLLITIPFLKFLNKKVIAKVSSAKLGIEAGSFYGRYGLLGNIFIRLLKNVDAFVAISEEIKEGLLAEGYEAGRVYRIPNSIDRSIFYSESKKETAESTVIFSGALDKRKGVEVLLEAWKDVHKIFPKCNLMILGKGPQKTYLEIKADRLGITDAVKFTGHVSSVPDYLRIADIFVLPSLQEGLPNSLLEAMACGLPVIASKIGGVVDVVEDGKSGILVEPGDISGLASAMVRLLKDNVLRQRLGEEARKRIVEGFSIDRIAEEYIKLYKKI
jgi:glycosyltransferase involved in cell wall biosynthesis